MLAFLLALTRLVTPAAVAQVLQLPTTDEGNLAAVATLTDREECDDDLEFQPWDCPERARWALLTISNRESPYNWSPSTRWVGQHVRQGDNRYSAGLGRRAHRRGTFQWWCPAHWGSEGFSTVGPHGLMYAFNVHRLDIPGNCVPWWVFATAEVSAHVALDRYLDRCELEPVGRSWCPKLAAVLATRTRWDRRAARARRAARLDVPAHDHGYPPARPGC